MPLIEINIEVCNSLQTIYYIYNIRTPIHAKNNNSEMLVSQK